MNYSLPFEKMQGVGNDFVVIDAADWRVAANSNPNWPQLAITLSNRHFGVGSDGLLVLEDSERAEYRMRMFNPDGTEDDCGNGLRCMARYICRKRELAPSSLHSIESVSGVHSVRVLEHSDRRSMVRINMGEPQFSPRFIPMLIVSERAVDYPIPLGDVERRFTCLNTGTPHAITFVDGRPSDELFFKESRLVEHHALFPERTSVMWAWPIGPQKLTIRIWERGAGETLGCGTGACAAAVAAQIRGLCSGTVEVTSTGGTLEIQWREGEEIWMTGPAVTVFTGEVCATPGLSHRSIG